MSTSTAGARRGTLGAVGALDETSPDVSEAETVDAGATRPVGEPIVPVHTVLPDRGAEGRAPTERRRRFRHVRPLGRGGLGEVVLAVDEDIHRKVAIKRIREEAITVPMLLRFAEEVRTIGRLEHPGIVPVHDVGIDETGKHYLVMKYVEGETLERVIDRLRAGDPEATHRFGHAERLDIVAKILEALSYAHAEGFIHRDLKPANVMVGSHGEVTLMDWGIAKPVGTEDPPDELAATDSRDARLVETSAGTILGTPLYMSPEQAAGKNRELDARADVFALGILVVELFTLRHPLEHLRNTAAVVATLLHEDLSNPAKLQRMFAAAKAPMDVLWFASRALRKDPSGRYADAEDMLRELRLVRAGLSAPRCHVTAAKRLLSRVDRWIDRHPNVFTALLMLGALGLVAGAVAGVWSLIS